MLPPHSSSGAHAVHQQLVDAIYAAGLGEQGWERFLAGLRQVMGSEIRAANLVTKLPGQDALFPLSSTADDATWQKNGVAAYIAEYHRYDPARQVLTDWQIGEWHSLQEQLDPRAYRKDRFVNEFLKGSHVEDTHGLKVSDGVHGEVFISFFCALGVRGMRSRQKRWVESLTPHVSRALQMQARMRSLEQGALLAETAFNALHMAILLLDERRTILGGNTKAFALLRHEPLLLGVRQGRLQPFGYSDPAAWAAALTDGKLNLRHAHGLLCFHLVPVPADAQLARHWQRPLTLMYAAAGQNRDQIHAHLVQRYRLTVAEADLALLIGLDGLSVKVCSDIRFVSLNTLRTQLKAIYAKTGLHRQADLIRLLQNL